jgi:uncharacterized protein (DUF983 family)
MNNYESGGVPPAPPYLQDKLVKCPECGAIFVGIVHHQHQCNNIGNENEKVNSTSERSKTA